MSAVNNSTLLWSGAAIVTAALLLSNATIVRNDVAAASASSGPTVDKLWPKIATHIDAKAVDINPLLQAMRENYDAAANKYGYRQGVDSAWTFIVRLDGTVVATSPDPVAPVLDIDTDGDGKADVQLLRGPLLLGTSLRDALPFVAYGDFDNQIQFAEFGAQLNGRAYAATGAHVRDAAPGQRLRLLATFSHDASRPLPLLMPVAILGSGH